jgi:hypothetical protein
LLHRNIRGIGIALCLLTLFIFLSGCGSLKDDTLLIANAVITEIDTAKQTITVKDDADESTLDSLSSAKLLAFKQKIPTAKAVVGIFKSDCAS